MTILTHAHQRLLQKLHADPERMALIEEKWPCVGAWEPFFFQYHQRDPDYLDKWHALQCLTRIEAGACYVFGLVVGSEPFSDCEVEANQRVLNEVPEPFRATFAPGDTIGIMTTDGTVEWTQPVRATLAGRDVTLEPRAVPLEVGCMPSVKAHYATGIGPGLARWPYGKTEVIVIVPTLEHSHEMAAQVQ